MAAADAGPYREPSPPKCDACETRRVELRGMQPFDIVPPCPACLAKETYRRWRIVCKGNGQRLVIQTSIWWWRRIIRTCSVSTPHFHMGCSNCGHEWLMRTALDREKTP